MSWHFHACSLLWICELIIFSHCWFCRCTFLWELQYFSRFIFCVCLRSFQLVWSWLDYRNGSDIKGLVHTVFSLYMHMGCSCNHAECTVFFFVVVCFFIKLSPYCGIRNFWIGLYIWMLARAMTKRAFLHWRFPTSYSNCFSFCSS